MPNDINDFEKKIFGWGGGGGSRQDSQCACPSPETAAYGKNLFLGSHYKHYNKNCNGHICILYT